MAQRYDGHTTIMPIQAGLIGHFGGEKCDPDWVKDEITRTYLSKKTQTQFRYPENILDYEGGYGYHDDSFTYETVGDIYW